MCHLYFLSFTQDAFASYKKGNAPWHFRKSYSKMKLKKKNLEVNKLKTFKTCRFYFLRTMFKSLKKFFKGDAVKSGKLEESVVRDRVKPLFYTRMRLGEFDPPEMNPYSSVNLSVIQSEEHRKLSLIAAAKSLVLLKRPSKFSRRHLIGGFPTERMAVCI